MKPTDLTEILWDYYTHHGRDLPWRHEPFDPYCILVSELMLQQTQVQRVIPKYQAFLAAFPTIEQLAKAPLSAVLQQWQGLGYNRRAKYLHEAAKQLASQPKPWTYDDLVACKGIGPNTAAAVCVYAYNEPRIFIETNIRTVLIHYLFPMQETVRDSQLIEQLERIIDHEHPREFYWALMDYGTHLKQTEGNATRRSHHYKKQSAFTGSRREIRGKVIRLLTVAPTPLAELEQTLGTDKRLGEVLTALEHEGLIAQKGQRYQLAP